MVKGGGRTEGRKDGRTEGLTDISKFPLCPTGHRPFGAAAQKGMGEGQGVKLSVNPCRSLLPVTHFVPMGIILHFIQSGYVICERHLGLSYC